MTLADALRKIPDSDPVANHTRAMIRLLENGYGLPDLRTLIELWRTSLRNAVHKGFENCELIPSGEKISGLNLDMTAGGQVILRAASCKQSPTIEFTLEEVGDERFALVELVSWSKKRETIELPVQA